MPFPPNRGGKIRPFNMVRHLSKNHSVTVASLAHSEQELRDGAGLSQYCAGVIVEVLPSSTRWIQACRMLFTNKPSSVASFWSSRLYERVQKERTRTKFDVVFVHCAFVAQYVSEPRGEFRVLDFGDLDSEKWFEYSRWKRFPISAGYGLEALKLRKYEKQIAGQFDRCTVTTSGELDIFKTLGASTSCQVIPNGVDTEYFHPRPGQVLDSPVVAFIGRMDYFPNVDGVLYFVRRILPLIRQRVPGVELRIIGSDPTPDIRRLARTPGIVVTGHVTDVRPYLIDAAVSVAPLRIARGTQNKILEAMAMGIPVVATPEAAKGIQATPGRHLLVGDGADGFADQVVKILHDSELRQDLAASGRRRIENAHVWSGSMGILDTILDRSISVVDQSITHDRGART